MRDAGALISMTWRSRHGGGAAVALASLALVATSAPEPDYLTEQANVVAPAGEGTVITLRMNADARADATGLEITNVVSVGPAPAGEAGPVTVTIERAFGGGVVATQEIGVEGGEAELRAGNIADCPEDGNCRQSFRVLVTPERAYDIRVTASLVNDEAGCAISNPSFSDDAELELTIQ